jgi:cis-3-alkyl-4-acyloxetan-2-one decarboxylase
MGGIFYLCYSKSMALADRLSLFLHRTLRIPFALHSYEFQSPKRPRATYVFIHGIGNTLHAWDDVVAQLPSDVRVIGIDLLGFGNSPKPSWAVYSAKTQARSVAMTLLGLRLVHQPILVGHSLGALVSVEVAKRYPLIARKLILCSPPFYKPRSVDSKRSSSIDDMLRTLYETARKHPDQLRYFSQMAVKVGLANKALTINDTTIDSYTAALESSIINQTALNDVAKLKLPITIFYGLFDPVVIRKHITTLAKNKPNVSLVKVNAGHEVVGRYAKYVANFINDQTSV